MVILWSSKIPTNNVPLSCTVVWLDYIIEGEERNGVKGYKILIICLFLLFHIMVIIEKALALYSLKEVNEVSVSLLF